MKRFNKTQFILDRFRRAAAHALHHRRKVADVAGQLAKFASWSQATPSFTHCYLAADRGVQFRGTSRSIVAELVELGFLTTWRTYINLRGRLCYVTRYVINHSKIAAYCAQHALKLTGGYGGRPRTAADWEAQRAAYNAAERQAKNTAAATAAMERDAAAAAHRAAAAERAAAYAARPRPTPIPAQTVAQADAIRAQLRQLKG